MLGHVTREIAKNLVKAAFPTLVTKMRRHTGRGRGEERPEAIADYCRSVFEGYLGMAGAPEPETLLESRVVVELGPGDTLGTGLLFLAHGARRYLAVDRFSHREQRERNAAVYRLLLEQLPLRERSRGEAALAGPPGRLRPRAERLGVLQQPAERLALPEQADLLVSQAVLEHVLDLSRVFQRMAAACRPGGLLLHQVDLGDHGLHPGEPFRFLAWSPGLWRAMHCFRGSPNRERLPRYRELLEENGLRCLRLEANATASPEEARAARCLLHPCFRDVSDEDLRVLSFCFAAQRIAPARA